MNEVHYNGYELKPRQILSELEKPTSRSGGGVINPVAYAKSGLIRTPLNAHKAWNSLINSCKTERELELVVRANVVSSAITTSEYREIAETETLMARCCSVTGEGMNEGWLMNDGDAYIKYPADAIAYIRKALDADSETELMSDDELFDKMMEEEIGFWTQWTNQNDYSCVVSDGVVIREL